MAMIRHPYRGLVRSLPVFLLLFCLSALPAAAQVPGRVNFQGLLLDSAGQPMTATVSLQLQLFSAATGGSALWTETHSSVSVTDGIYDVVLGSLTPLTPALFSASPRYLEVTINGQVLTPRREFVAVPFALKADTANTATTATTADFATNAGHATTADSATTATTADTATTVQNVGGVSADFVTQAYDYGDFDGSGTPNSDPTEGLSDVDSDGAANFVDADNDDDGLSDASEVSQGSNPNLVTPSIASFTPPDMLEQTSATVTVTGTNFDEPGLAVVFGSQSPTPTNVTPTSFQVSVGPQPSGTVSVVISLGNGESVQGSFTFRKRVTAFVTSTSYDGNLGGLAGADANCQARATAAGLSGTYFAWIVQASDSSRVANQWPAGAVFELVTGVQFASSFNVLVNTSVHTPPLALDEFGSPVNALAWTGIGGTSCTNWSTNVFGVNGWRGAVNFGGLDWQIGGQSGPCNQTGRLYCFEH